MTKYQTAKDILKSVALRAKKEYKGDKPAIRQSVNDYTHELCRDFNLSKYQSNLLHNYACELHPK
jgi:hypothetical protein